MIDAANAPYVAWKSLAYSMKIVSPRLTSAHSTTPTAAPGVNMRSGALVLGSVL